MKLALQGAIDHFHLYSTLIIFTDSEYVFGLLSGDSVSSDTNKDLVMEIKTKVNAMRSVRTVTFYKVPAHAKIPGNDFADELAGKAAAGGKFLEYLSTQKSFKYLITSQDARASPRSNKASTVSIFEKKCAGGGEYVFSNSESSVSIVEEKYVGVGESIFSRKTSCTSQHPELKSSLHNENKSESIDLAVRHNYLGLPSPIDIANHPSCYRSIPWACKSLWVQACRSILRDYAEASFREDHSVMTSEIVSLLALPVRVLQYKQDKRRMNRVRKINKYLNEFITDKEVSLM